MARAYWLMKSEPFKYPWEQLVRDGSTYWDGVRNYEARNNLAAMKKGDLALFYHSNEGKEVVGVAEIVKESYPDPTTDDERWVVVEISDVEAEVHDVAVLHDVFLAFEAHLAGFASRRPRP
jgi:predicted RNA-binding protein with PUA-like domain